ncbi:hypothetical protein PVL29_001058 [Vitis rotundifolia]|uniref:Uncharacterized protein n=1 Tax=Vitis rotundifolia TaxID=103349 RepID=A0AA39ALV2_VITRO|nr:hypothetical protein PVL29_001058 [Vitis rotundifolia]
MEVTQDATENAKQNAGTEAALAKESLEISKSEVKQIELMLGNVEAGGSLSHFNTQNSGSNLNLPVPLNKGDTTSISSIKRQESIQIDSANRELTIHGQISQQLPCSIVKQAYSNDLKALELILNMKKMKLKHNLLSTPIHIFWKG